MSILDAFRLDRKVAIVTGCNTGLGQAMAIGLAEAGADIAGVYRSETSETEAAVEATGRRFLPIKADLSEPRVSEEVVARAAEGLGRVDILVNNAGIIRRNDLLEFEESDWDAVMNTNLKTLFFLSQAFARRLVSESKPGKIVNIASMLSYQGGIRVASYTASKSGVMGLTRLMANELAGRGINVNGIAPGYMATNNTKALREDKERNSAILSRIPAGRWGSSEDLQGAAVFLSSAASDYMHGFTIAVDGGWLAR